MPVPHQAWVNCFSDRIQVATGSGGFLRKFKNARKIFLGDAYHQQLARSKTFAQVHFMRIQQSTIPPSQVFRRNPALSVEAISSAGRHLLLDLIKLRSRTISFSCEKGRVLADFNQLSRVPAKSRKLWNPETVDQGPSASAGLLQMRGNRSRP